MPGILTPTSPGAYELVQASNTLAALIGWGAINAPEASGVALTEWLHNLSKHVITKYSTLGWEYRDRLVKLADLDIRKIQPLEHDDALYFLPAFTEAITKIEAATTGFQRFVRRHSWFFPVTGLLLAGGVTFVVLRRRSRAAR